MSTNTPEGSTIPGAWGRTAGWISSPRSDSTPATTRFTIVWRSFSLDMGPRSLARRARRAPEHGQRALEQVGESSACLAAFLDDLGVVRRRVGDARGEVGDARNGAHAHSRRVRGERFEHRAHADRVDTHPGEHADLRRRLVRRPEQAGVDAAPELEPEPARRSRECTSLRLVVRIPDTAFAVRERRLA